MTRFRRLGALLIATPLATGFTLFASPASAYAAAGTITTPSNGAVITSGSQLTARATYNGMLLGVNLRVTSPGAGEETLAKSPPSLGSGSLSGSFGIRQNGKYTVRLVGTTTRVYDTSTVYVRIPPARPSGLSARVSGNTLTVNWNLGLEDDLTGYSVSASGVDSDSGSTGEYCSGTICSTKFTLGSADGDSTTVSVQARRSNGTGGYVSSGAATDSVDLPGGGGSEGDGGGGGGNGDGSLTLPDDNGRDGNEPLPPLNGDSPVTLPNVQPDGAAPGFTYPAPVVAGDNALGPVPDAISNLQWGKSVALASVMLLIAAHLGTWTRRMRVAQAGLSRQGMAARSAKGGSGRARVKKAQERIARAQALAKNAMPAKLRPADKKGRSTTASKRRPPNPNKNTRPATKKPTRDIRPQGTTPQPGSSTRRPTPRASAERNAIRPNGFTPSVPTPRPTPKPVTTPSPSAAAPAGRKTTPAVPPAPSTSSVFGVPSAWATPPTSSPSKNATPPSPKETA